MVFDRTRLFVIVVAFTGMVVLCFTQVILRYFVFLDFRPFPWGDEMLRHTAIWLAFLAASVGVREGNHLHLEFFLVKLCRGKALYIARKLILIIAIGAMCLLIYHGTALTMMNRVNYLQNIRISVALFNAAIPVGCFFIMCEFLLILIFGRHPFARSSAPPKEPAAAADVA